LETKKLLAKLPYNAIVLIKTRDLSFKVDIKVYAKQTGHLLLKLWQEEQDFYALLQKQ
jgi:TusA-related sulfurtransferase